MYSYNKTKIPPNIIFCNQNDQLDIFIEKNPYVYTGTIYNILNYFSPPFYQIVILLETKKTTDDDLKILYNITIQGGFLIIPKNIWRNKIFQNLKDISTKEYFNYIQIHKK